MLACVKTTTVTETLTTFKFKCCFFRTGNFVFKAPICFSISFGLGIISHTFFFIRDLNLLL